MAFETDPDSFDVDDADLLEVDDEWDAAMDADIKDDSDSFAAMPPGPYLVRITEVERSERPGKSGYHFIKLTMKTACYLPDESRSRHVGRLVWSNLFLSPKPYCQKQIQAFARAFEIEKGTGTAGIKKAIAEKRACRAVMKVETYRKDRGENAGDVVTSLSVDTWIPLSDSDKEILSAQPPDVGDDDVPW